MPAYKGTKELPKASNKQARGMFTSMQKDREAMAKGRPDSVQRGEKGENASMKKFAKGGVTKEMPTSDQMGSMNMAKGGKAKAKPAAKGKPFAATKFGAAMMKKSADTKGRAMKFAKGGSVSSRADGCATKGKTKGKMLARGGKTC